MTSPDGAIPERTLTSGELAEMQDYTQEGIAQQRNADMQAAAELARDKFWNNILGGFFSVPAAIVQAILDFIEDLVYALKGITGGFIDLTGFFQDIESTAIAAGDLANTANEAAEQAIVLAGTAQEQSADAITAAELAANTAAAAQEAADIAYGLSSYWESECVIASAEVVNGVNELIIGLGQNVPDDRDRFVTDIHYALKKQVNGITIQTHKYDETGTIDTLLHTATLGAGVTRINYSTLTLEMLDKERVFWYVSSITGSEPPEVLQALIFGVILGES